MNKNKKVLVLSTIGILVMVLGIIGVTYAWFSSSINGSGANFNVTTATVGPLTYTGTEITATGVLPGWISEDATLKVEGTVTGDQNVAYTCNIENTGEITDVEYRISGDGTSTSENEQWHNINDSILVSGVINNTNSIDEYKLAVRFKETGLDQNDQQGKTLSVNVTCEVVDASVDANIVAWTLDGETQTEEIPQKGSGYSVDNISCTNEATGKWDYHEWGLDVRNITETPTNCTVNFVSVGNYLYKQILTDNPTVDTRNTFDAIYTESNNGNTIYEAEGQDGAKTYYFAGNVTNNYVKFADRYWRIIRINEDNSIRLLHYGTDINGNGMFTSTSQVFNTDFDNSSYVGYKYTLDSQHSVGTNSEIKTYLDNWYTSNLASYDTYISRTAIYCNDRTVVDGSWAISPGTWFSYAGYTRLNTYKTTTPTPTFACSNAADKFTGSEVTGNGELGEKPIGLITADEIAFAGGLWNTNNTSYYISEKATGAEYWWTMTPCNWENGFANEFVIGGSTNTGYLNLDWMLGELGVRPVISLKSCVTWSNGNGTSDSPYEVTNNDACAALEN